jgi:nucleotide-binding universal stress UspA family protein
MYRNILLGTDGSDHARTAAGHAIAAADCFDCTLHALYVIETRTAYDNAIVDRETVTANLREEGTAALEAVAERAESEGVETVTSIEEGIPAEQLCSYIEREGIDMVYLGERGQSEFKTVLLGSTSETVIHETEIPVVVL